MIGVLLNAKSSTSLASGSLATVSWYLIERACFSEISAFKRSPTNRCGSCFRLKVRGLAKVRAVFVFAIAAYDIVRLPKLLAPSGEVCPAA